MRAFLFFGLLFSLLCEAALAVPARLKPADIPPDLKPWAGWALYGHEEQLECAALFNDGAAFQCRWPTRLDLRLDDQGGTFSQSWYLQREGWITLPGKEPQWPLEVEIDGAPGLVTNRDGRPAIWMGAGEHAVKGAFRWQRLPEALSLPPQTGLLAVILRGESLFRLEIDAEDRLWLRTEQPTERIEDRIDLRVFRSLDDLIPLRATVHLDLEVAGRPRELKIGRASCRERV